MKKTITLTAFLALFATVQAQDIQVLSCGEGIPGRDEPQLMGLNISPNSKYICGAIEVGEGIFVADRLTGEVKYLATTDDEGAELRHVDNNGVAIGYDGSGITYSFLTGEETPLQAPAGYREVIGEDITNDGSLMVAGLTNKSFTTSAAYSTDGINWENLPIPSLEELGTVGAPFADKGSSAKLVSGDGKVIFGFIGSFALPMVWIMDADGQYAPDFFVGRYMKRGDEDIDNPDRPLIGISGMYLSMSNNGKYVCMQGIILSEDKSENIKLPIVYDTEKRELIILNDGGKVDEYGGGFYPISISDNRTIIGTIGQPYYGALCSFIWPGDKELPMPYNEAFPDYAERFGEAERLGFNMPTSISADSRYLVGYTYYCKDYNNADEDAYYVTYVIDRGEEVGVDAIAAPDNAVDATFTLEGRRTSGLTKGINIIRKADGSTRKIMVR